MSTAPPVAVRPASVRALTIIVVASILILMVPFSPAEAAVLPSDVDELSFEADPREGDVAGLTEALDEAAEVEELSEDRTESDALAEGPFAPLSSADDEQEAVDPEDWITSPPTEAPMPFSMVGFEMPDGATVAFRTSVDGDAWTTWSVAEAMDEEDGPDPTSDEKAAERDSAMSDPFWVEEATHIQISIDRGEPTDVTAHLIDSNGLSASLSARFKAALTRPWIDTTPAAAEAATRPNVRSRSSWDPNNDCRPRSNPSYANSVRQVVVHHTAGSNSYTNGNAVVLGICRYHRDGNGWNDIGYNALVDRSGNVYEGRLGGLERAVIGAHAANYNTGSFGIAVMGNHDQVQVPAAAFNSVAQTIAWKSRLHGINPTGSVSVNGRTMSTIVGHRDVGSTACPGRYFYPRMDELRRRVAEQTGSTASFSDIGGSHAPFIRDIAQRGITAGCGGSRYCPDRAVTRAQMATFLQRAEGRQSPRWGTRFSDVSSTDTHAPDINAIAHAGWTQSCNSTQGGDRFCPDRHVTRGEMATFIVRAHPNLRPVDRPSSFRDVPSDLSHRPFINALSDAGITVGCGNGNYCPDRTVTRGEMATFISRAMATGMGG